MRRVGLFGCGNIGEIIARRADDIQVIAAYDRLPDRAEKIARLSGAASCKTFNLLVHMDEPLVIGA